MTVISDKIRSMKAANPSMKNVDIAKRVGCTPPNVTQILSLIPCAVRTAHHSLSPATAKLPMFRFKAKMMKAFYGIEVKIVQ